MKKIYTLSNLITLTLLLLAGCNSGKSDEQVTDDEIPEHSDTSVVYDPARAMWEYAYNRQTEDFEILQLRPVSADTLTGIMIQNILNDSWPRIPVRFMKVSNDTAYVEIPVSTVLTQQMGTTGAMSYMISATYSFTELQGVEYVRFDFDEGDHAVPGVYSRRLWEELTRPLTR